MSFAIVQNDLEPDMLLTMSVNGVAEDLSDITGDIVLNWRKPNGTTATKNLTAESLGSGLVRCSWTTGDTAIPGRHYGQVTVTRGNGQTQTFPNTQDAFTWEVVAKIGA